MIPALTRAHRAGLVRLGRSDHIPAGTVLRRPDEPCPGLLIVVKGAVDLCRGDMIVSRRHARGEPVLISGPSPFTTVTAAPAHVISLTPAGFRDLSRADPGLADSLLLGLLSRRRDSAAGRRIEIVGSARSVLSNKLQAYANRRRLPHDWLDEEHVTGRALMLSAWLEPDDLPAVFTLGRAHRRVTPRALAMLLGLPSAD